MRKTYLLLFLPFIVAMFALAVSAGPTLDTSNGVFLDGFENGNLLGGWNQSGAAWTVVTTNPANGTQHAQAGNTAAISALLNNSINTSGFHSIMLSYSRRLILTETGDSFSSEYWNGSKWTLIENSSTEDLGGYLPINQSLSADASNKPEFAIKFECKTNQNSERCRLDHVIVSGFAETPPNASSPNLSDSTPLAQAPVCISAGISSFNGSSVSSVIAHINNGSNTILLSLSDTGTECNSAHNDGTYSGLFLPLAGTTYTWADVIATDTFGRRKNHTVNKLIQTLFTFPAFGNGTFDAEKALLSDNSSASLSLLNVSDDSKSSQIILAGSDSYFSFNITLNSSPHYPKEVNISIETSYLSTTGVISELQILNGSSYISICNLSVSLIDTISNCGLGTYVNSSRQFNFLALRIKTNATIATTQNIDFTVATARLASVVATLDSSTPNQAQHVTVSGDGWTNESGVTIDVHFNGSSIGGVFPVNTSSQQSLLSFGFELNDTMPLGNYTLIAYQSSDPAKNDSSTFVVGDEVLVELSSDIVSPSATLEVLSRSIFSTATIDIRFNGSSVAGFPVNRSANSRGVANVGFVPNANLGLYIVNVSDNATGTSRIDNFTVRAAERLNFSVLSASNSPVNTTVRLYRNGTLLGQEDYNASLLLDHGVRYDLELDINNSPIKGVKIINATLDANSLSTIGIDDVPENLSIPEAFFAPNQIYAFNPPAFNFSSINVTVTASAGAKMLMKCEGYNFSTQTCYGGWKAWQGIQPGQNYTFALNSTDPALAEVNATFFDGFENNNLLNGWNVSGTPTNQWTTTITQTFGGSAFSAEVARTDTIAILNNTINTSGFTNITFSFARATANTEATPPADFISTEWWNGATWTLIDNTSASASYVLINQTLPTSAWNNSVFAIRFICQNNANNERCRVDNVLVSGIAIVLDTRAPQVLIVSPSNGTRFEPAERVLIRINATDLNGISSAQVNITKPDNSPELKTLTSAGGNLFEFNFTNTSIQGRYDFKFIVTDPAGNINSSENGFFRINDSLAPNVTSMTPTNGTVFSVSDSIEVKATIVDNFRINVTTVNITRPNGVIDTRVLTNLSSLFNASYTIPNITGTYTIRFYANDTNNNINSSESVFFVGNDTVPPLVVSLNPSSNSVFNVSSTIEIKANITDNVLLNVTSVNITSPNGSIQTLSLTHAGGNLYNNTFTIPTVVGVYTIRYFANDSTGNINSTETRTFNATGFASVKISVNQSLYDQGSSATADQNPGFGVQIRIPFQVRLFDSLSGEASTINDSTCIVRSNNTVGTSTLVFNQSTGNYTGSISTHLEYGNSTYTASCDSPFHSFASNFTLTSIRFVGYLIERPNNISFGGPNNNITSASTWLSKLKPNTTHAINKTITIQVAPNATDIFINRTLFCGANFQSPCAFQKDFNMKGRTDLRLNASASANDTCIVKGCIEVFSNNFQVLFSQCSNGSQISTDSNILAYALSLTNITISQGNFFGLSLKCDAHPSLNSTRNLTVVGFYNYSDEPINLEVELPFTQEVVSRDVDHTQAISPITIGPKSNFTIGVNHSIQYNNSLNTSRFLHIIYPLKVLDTFRQSAVPNATYIYNSTGGLWASDNQSAPTQRNASVENDIITYDTETIPGLTPINNTISVLHRDAIRDNETLLVNQSGSIQWQARIHSIFTDDIHLHDVIVFTNYSRLGVSPESEFGFFVELSNSTGTFNLTAQTLVNTTSKTLTFPTTGLSTITYTIEARDRFAPRVVNVSANPQSTDPGPMINLSAIVDDPIAVSAVIVQIRLPNGSASNLSSSNSSDHYSVLFNSTGQSTGTYNATFIANDSINNINATESVLFRIGVPPSAIIVRPQGSSFRDGERISIAVNVSDASGVDNITAYITLPNGSVINSSLFVNDSPSDNFDSNSENITWVKNSAIGVGENCTADINVSEQGYALTKITGSSSTLALSACGFTSMRPLEGDFNLSIHWNTTAPRKRDGSVGIILSEDNDVDPSNHRIILLNTNRSGLGQINQLFKNDNGTLANINNIPTSTSDFATFSIVRTGPNFSFYQNSGSGFSLITSTIANLSGILFVQFGAINLLPGDGEISVSWDNLSIQSDPFLYTEFNQSTQIGNYSISLFANDTFNAINNSERSNFTIYLSNDPPVTPVIAVPSPGQIVRGTINISWVTVTDPENSTFAYNITLLNPSLSINQSIVTNLPNTPAPRTTYELNTLNFSDGVYNLRVTAYENETANGLSNTDTIDGNFTIDNTIPSAIIISPSNNSIFNLSDMVTIRANMTDAFGVGATSAEITGPDGSIRLIPMTPAGGSTYEGNYSNTTVVGNHSVFIIVNDTAGNQNNDIEGAFFVRDSLAPNVSGLSPENGTVYNTLETAMISATIKDNINVSRATVNITLPNGSVDLRNLSNQSSTYQTDYLIPSLSGNYTVRFSANDTSGNINSSETLFFVASTNTSPILRSAKGTYNQSQTLRINGSRWPHESDVTLDLVRNGSSLGGIFPLNVSTINSSLFFEMELNDTFPLGSYVLSGVSVNNASHNASVAFNVSDIIMLELSSDIVSPGVNLIIVGRSFGGIATIDIQFNGTSVSGYPLNRTANDRGVVGVGFTPNSTLGIYTINISDLNSGLRLLENLTVVAAQASNFSILSANNASLNVSVRFLINGSLIAQDDYNVSQTLDFGQHYDIEILANGTPASRIMIFNSTISPSSPRTFGLDDPPNNMSIPDAFNSQIYEIYAINPPGFNFSSMNVTVTAGEQSRALYKCEGYNFSTQTCYGGWKGLLSLEPGQNYTFTLNSTDPALAEVGGVFFDGFETGNFLNGWNVSAGAGGWTVSGTNVFAGSFKAEAGNTGGAIRELNNSVNTSSFRNITFSFAYQTVNTEAGDWLAAEYYNGTSWTTSLNTTSTVAYTLFNQTLIGNASDNPDFAIRFLCITNSGNERCRIDSVVVTGIEIDRRAPLVSIIAPSNGTTYNPYETVTIRANITDNVLVNDTFVNISKPDGFDQTHRLSHAGGNLYEFNFSNTSVQGIYTFRILANDSNDNKNNSETGSFRVNDSLAPNVTNMIPVSGKQFNVSQTIEIGANISDNADVNVTTINITMPNGTVVTQTLANGTLNFHNTSFTIPALLGNYTVRFFANDSNNNINSTETTFFVGVDTQAPSLVFDNFTAIINATHNTTILNETTFRTINQLAIYFNISDNNQLDRLKLFYRSSNGSAQDTCPGFNSSIGTTGNTQHSSCFEYIEFDNSSDTQTYSLNPGLADRTTLSSEGGGRYKWIVDEMYRPLFKNYPLNGSTQHFNNSNNITGSRTIRQVIGHDMNIPEDADSYLLQFSLNYTNASSSANRATLHAYLCNNLYPDGKNYHDSPNCARINNILEQSPTLFNLRFSQDIFTLIGNLSNASVIIHYPQGNDSADSNDSNALFPLLAQASNASRQNLTFIGHDFNYSNQTALYPLSWDLHLHWVYEGESCIEFFASANDSQGNSKNSTLERRCWTDFGENFPPGTPRLETPEAGQSISRLFNVTWNQATDPDGDNYNSTLLLLNSDTTLNTILANNSIPKFTEDYTFNSSAFPDGSYRLRLFHTDVFNASSANSTTGIFFIDNSGPNVTGITPNNGSTYNISSTIEISANITDATSVNASSINITLPNGTIVTSNLSNVSNKYNSSFVIPNLTGSYTVRFFANDSLGNVNSSETVFFVGTDQIFAPQVTIIAPTNGSTFNQSATVRIVANISDNIQVNTTFVNISKPDGSSDLRTLTLNSTPFYETNFTNSSIIGNYTIRILANDSFGNRNDTETGYFTIRDSVAPSVVIVSPANASNSTQGQQVNISVNVTDNSAVHKVLANISLPDGNSNLLTLSLSAGLYQGVFGSTSQTGNYTLRIIANDTAGNVNSTQNHLFIVLDAGFPVITDVNPTDGSTFEVYSIVNISANVSDNLAVGTVLANITLPNGSSVLTQLINSSSDIYNVSFNGTVLLGTYNLSIRANDSDGNNASAQSSFIIDDTLAPAYAMVACTPAFISLNRSTVCNATVTDNFALANVSVNVTLPNGTQVFPTLTQIGNVFSFTFNQTGLIGDNYTINFTANDSQGNIAYNSTTLVVIQPFIEIAGCRPDPINLSQSTTCSANVTSGLVNFGVGTVLANVSAPDGTTNIQTVNNVSTTYNFTFFNSTVVGNHSVRWFANDSTGQKAERGDSFFVNDNLAPNVSNLFPSNGTVYNVSTTIEISATIIDNVNVSNASINVTLPNGSVVFSNLNNFSNKYNSSFTIPNQTGSYFVRFFANDTYGNVNTTETLFFVGNDSIAPSAVIVRPSNGSIFNVSDTVLITANISDNVAVGSTLVNITQPNGASQLRSLTLNSTPFYANNYTNTTLVGTYTFRILSNDSTGNRNDSQNGFFTIRDNLAPNVSSLKPLNDSGFNITSTIEISATIIDNVNVSNASINVTLPNGTIVLIPLNNFSSKYNTSFTLLNITANYSVRFFANDTSGNINSSETITFEGTTDENAPNATIVRPSNGTIYNVSAIVNILANVTDDVTVGLVQANISKPDGASDLISLTLNSTPFYEANFSNTTLVGTYTFRLLARDSSNNLNDSSTGTFVVRDSIAPKVSNLFPSNGTVFNATTAIEISATIIDNINVSTASINVTLPNGSIVFSSLSNFSNKYNTSFLIPNLTGNYTVRFFANDSNGNVNSTETLFFVGSEGYAPSVVITQPLNGTVSNLSSVVLIQARITDGSGVNATFVNITKPDGSGDLRELKPNVSPYYEVNFTNGTVVGTYTFRILANDTQGNRNHSETGNIVVRDNLAPNVSNLFPSNGTVYNVSITIEISATIVDNINVSNASINITLPNGSVVYTNLNNFSSKHNSSFFVPNQTGSYFVRFFANDTYGNVNSTETIFFVGNDNLAPQVINLTPINASTYNPFEPVLITANITDNIRVNDSFVNVTRSDGTTQNLRMSFISGNIYGFNFTNTSGQGTYTYRIIANDTTNNINATETGSFRINDSLAPNITSILPTNGTTFNLNSTIEIRASITDAVNISNASINITLPNATVVSRFLSNTSSIWNTSFTLDNLTGNYTLRFFANDSNNNINSSETIRFAVAAVVDNTAPSVTNLSPANGTRYLINDTVLISVNVSDNNSIASVIATIVKPDGFAETVNLSNTSSTYSGTYSNLTLKNNYTIIINATDAFGNVNSSIRGYFTRITRDNKTVDVIDENNRSINFSQGVLANTSGLLTLQLNFSSLIIHSITLFGYNSSSPLGFLRISNSTSDQGRFVATFAIDPSAVAFSTMNVTYTARGNALYKCLDYTFANRTCNDGYELFANLTPGRNITFTLNSTDPGFGDQSPDEGTPEDGGAEAAGAGFNGPFNTFTATQADDAVYFGLRRINGAGTNNDLGAFINLTYNISNLTATQGLTASKIKNLSFLTNYCFSNDVVGVFTCGGAGIGGEGQFPLSAQILNVTSGQWQDFGAYNATPAVSTEVNDTFNVSSGFADFISAGNLINVRYEANVTITVNGNDAAFGIDYASLTVSFDTLAPNVTGPVPPNGTLVNTSTTVNIGAFIVDDQNLNVTSINVTFPNGTIQQFNLSNSSNFHNTSFIAPNLTGNYTVRFFANDSVNNINSTISSFFTVVDGLFGPRVLVVLPQAGTNITQNDTVTITANITDNIRVNLSTVNITVPNGTVLTRPLSPAGGDLYSYNFSGTAANGTYLVRFFANDTSGNVNSSETTNFTIMLRDVTPPNVTVLGCVPFMPNLSQSVLCNATVVDGANVTMVNATIRAPGGTIFVANVSNISSNYFFNFSNTGFLGLHNVSWLAQDNSNNTRLANDSFVVRENLAPSVVVISPVNGTVFNQSTIVLLRINATDANSSISTARANISYPNGTSQIVSLTPNATPFFDFNFSNTSSIGNYSITFLVNDSYDNVNATTSAYFTVRDSIAPVIVIISPNSGQNFAIGSNITLRANVTDNVNVSTVSANITLPNGSILVFNLTPAGGNLFEANLTNATEPGTYTLRVLANDSASNSASTSITFTVGVAVGAAAAEGGGGRGGGQGGSSSELAHGRSDRCELGKRECAGDTVLVCIRSTEGTIWEQESCGDGKTCQDGQCVDKGCSEDWICSDWGDCRGGHATRDCQDYNKCGTNAHRPDVTRLCQQVAGPPSSGQEPGRLSLPLEPSTPSFYDKLKAGAIALKFLLLLAILSAIGAVGYMLTRGPLPALLEDAEEEARFEKAGDDAIYVPFSYVQQAKEVISILQSKPRKEALNEIRGKYAPVVVSLCLKVLAEERKDSHTAKHPVLEVYHDYVSYETLHTLIRMIADARHHELDLALPGSDDAGVSAPISAKTPETIGSSNAQIQDGYVVLPESEDGPHKRAVVHIKLVDSKSVKTIQDLLRTGSVLVLIDISHTDSEHTKTLIGAVKHTAKATDSRLLILDEKTIIAIGRGMTLA